MNSKERIIAALKSEPVDYVPCMIGFAHVSPSLRKGYQWQFPWSENSSQEERLKYQVEELGLDQVVLVGTGLQGPAPGLSSKTWLEGDVLHKSYTTPSGELHASVKYNDLWPHGEDIPFYSDFNVGHFIDPWIVNESDMKCFKEVWQICETKDTLLKIRENYNVSRQLADRFGLAVSAPVGSGLTGAQHLFGVEGLCLTTLDNPGLVEEYLEYEHNINLRNISMAGDLGVDIVGRNGFYESADFYSPEMLEQFLKQRLTREANLAREAGLISRYTMHTGVMPLLDYLDSLPFDAIIAMDIAFKDFDLSKVYKKLAHSKSLVIGPSGTYHLWKGPEITRKAVQSVFEVFKDRKGLVLAPCPSAHSIMPWESTLAMIDEWKNLRSL